VPQVDIANPASTPFASATRPQGYHHHCRLKWNEMASRTSTPRSRSRSQSSTGSSGSSDTAMLDAPPKSPSRPVRLRNPSTSNPSTASQAPSSDPSFSLLLSLPRELRERIYAFTLTTPYPFWWPNQAPLKHTVGVNLLRTNKQVYEESVSILYSANKFLFTHPSDCNIFRVIASPASHYITCVYFRIREKDLRLWTSYLGSKTSERSLKSDLPNLKQLWVFMRCGNMGTPAIMNQLVGNGQLGVLGGLPPAVALNVQAVQNALGQQVAALQQQVQYMTPTEAGEASEPPQENAGQPPSPPIPHPAMPFAQFQQHGVLQFHNQHHPQPLPPPPPPIFLHAPSANVPNFFGIQPPVQAPPPHAPLAFLRFDRELGVESLCLSLAETRRKDTEVKIVCIMRIPKREVDRFCRMYPEELERDRHGDARTRFRRLHGAEVSLEISGYELPATTAVTTG
jgi:hypothetical protein